MEVFPEAEQAVCDEQCVHVGVCLYEAHLTVTIGDVILLAKVIHRPSVQSGASAP